MGICNSRLKKLTSYIEPQECRKEILKNDGEKHALVLAGGGGFAAFQVGVISVLTSHVPNYEIITGISAGALNASILSMYPQGQERIGSGDLTRFWKEFKPSDMYKNHFCGCGGLKYCCALKKMGMLNSNGVQNMVDHVFDKYLTIQSERIFKVGACDLDTGEYKEFDAYDPDIKSAIYASCAYPGYLEPIKIRDHFYSDGGIRNIIGPIENVLKQGATVVDIVLCSPCHMKYDSDHDNAVDVLLRTFDIRSNELVRDDMNFIRPPGVKFRVFQPKKRLGNYKSMLNFNHNQIEEWMKLGRECAVEILNKRKYE
jgi:predicted acylesterase/phospholipase RssA